MLEKVLIFISFLCPLIFFHELGHFFFARFFGVHVEVFSIGFGPKILKWKKKGTEYALSIIPLGGYVKMFGDDVLNGQSIPEERRSEAFSHKGKWARFWIVFGGPLANFILAFFIFWLLTMQGEKIPEAKLGNVPENSKLYSLGLRSADIIKMINQHDIYGMADLEISDERLNRLKVLRQGKEFEIHLDEPYKDFVENFFSIDPRLRIPIFIDVKGQFWGISETENWNEQISLENLETKSKIFLTPLNLDKLSSKYSAKNTERISLEKNENISLVQWLSSKGYYPLDLRIKSIVMGSPADKLGLKEGDIVTKLDGQEVESFELLRDKIQQAGASRKVKVDYLRGAEEKVLELIPEAKEFEGKKIYTLGIFSSAEFIPANFVITPSRGPIESIGIAFKRTAEGIVTTVSGFKKLITNEVSLKNVGGPIAIGKVASDSLAIGLSYFFRLMALISINLGVINLFPIPVLDGGHITFIFFELINRGPLSRRKMEVAQQLGVSLLFLLIFVALFNDISRFF